MSKRANLVKMHLMNQFNNCLDPELLGDVVELHVEFSVLDPGFNKELAHSTKRLDFHKTARN